MTGYANAAIETAAGGPSLTVEARSVNGRFLDLVLKLPDEIRGLEPALRERLAGAFKRGKIELRISVTGESDTAMPSPNPEQLMRLSHQQGAVQGWLPQARGLSVNEVFNWCRSGARSHRLDEPALTAAEACIAGLLEARAREGERLMAMLLQRLERLRELAAQAGPLLPVVVQRQQARFLERWNEALSAAEGGASIPPQALHERALGEAASFAIRIDVAEELTRLSSHVAEIERLLNSGGELGKRLEFLIQELQREANTLGSKSAAIELTTIAIEMKVAIEQMREQVQNIE